MVLDMPGLFGDNRLFEPSPEDGQVGYSAGQRIIPTDVPDTVTLTPLETALNVLELQAATAITPGVYQGLHMDVFSDADGFLDTIDTAETTAIYNITDETYVNGAAAEFLSVQDDAANVVSYGEGTYYLKKTFDNLNYKVSKGTNELDCSPSCPSGNCKYIFYYDDESNESVINSTTSDSYVPKTYTNPEPTKTVTKIEVWLAEGGSSGAFYEHLDKVYALPDIENRIVQTDPITITTGVTNFQVVAHRQSTTGTGTVTADVSFNNGTNYQTVPVNTNSTVENSGTEMIVKLNLNAGASAGTAEAKGWGIQLW